MRQLNKARGGGINEAYDLPDALSFDQDIIRGGPSRDEDAFSEELNQTLIMITNALKQISSAD